MQAEDNGQGMELGGPSGEQATEDSEFRELGSFWGAGRKPSFATEGGIVFIIQDN